MATENYTSWRSRLPHGRLGQFTFVMATGIVSTAMHNTRAHELSFGMFILAVISYCVLVVCVVLNALFITESVSGSR